MDRDPSRQRWEREAPPRGFNYHDRQAARDRNDFPVAKRGRREASPGYHPYPRDVSPNNLGPAYSAGPRDRFEGYPPEGIGRGRGMPGRGYGHMPEQRRAPYPTAPPAARPLPPVRAVWPGSEPRGFGDVPKRQAPFYPQREVSPTPSPRSWQATPHALDPTLPPGALGAAHLHGPARYGSPAHFDPMAPAPREAAHITHHLRFQEEAERRPSPRGLNRPLSRGPSLERSAWQQPPMRGYGPGLGPFVPGSQGPQRPSMVAGPIRREAGYRYPQGQPAPAVSRGRGRGRGPDTRARPVAGRGPAPFSRGQGQDKPVSVPFSRGQGQDRSAPGPFSRAGQDRSGSAPRHRSFSRERGPAGPPGADDALSFGAGAISHAHKAPIRTPERAQRSSGARDGSRDSRRDEHSARSRDTAQRQHSSSSRPSRGTSGAAGNSPMRSSGASRELARRQSSGKHDSSPPKSRLSAPQLAATAATSQMSEANRPSVTLPEPPAAPTPLPPPPKPTPASELLPHLSAASFSAPLESAANNKSSSPGFNPAHHMGSTSHQPATVESASFPQPAAASATRTPAAPAAVAVKAEDNGMPLEQGTAAQTEHPPAHPPPVIEEPLPKRPKLQFGKGLASRMSLAAQSDFNLPDLEAATAEAQRAQQASIQEHAQLLGTQADAQPQLQSHNHTPTRTRAEQLERESDSPAVAETSLEDLLAQNSPGSLHRSSWVQIHKDLLTLNNHKARLQASINDLSEQEQTLQCEVEQAQAQQEAEDRQQQELQGQRAKALEKEVNSASELAKTQNEIAQLQTQMQQVPVLAEVSQSEDEDPDISSSDESDSESDSDHERSPSGLLRNGLEQSHGPAVRVMPQNGLQGANGRWMCLVAMMRQIEPTREQHPRLEPLVTALQSDQIEAQTVEIYRQNREILNQDLWDHEAAIRTSIPIATDRIDVENLSYIQYTLDKHKVIRGAMMQQMKRRREAEKVKQIEIAARYNAAHEQSHALNAGQEGEQPGDFTAEERARIRLAKERICNQVKLPDQILDPEERRNSIFVDRNNQYDLREARDEEQASLQLDAADQKKFGGAFVKFPKKWGKIAEIMGDRTPCQCAMIYNDQKDYDWFHPWLSQYGRNKRRTVGNRQQRFLSSASAITARPDSAEKPPKGRVTTVVATAVTSQSPLVAEVPARALRGRGRGATARGAGRGPALRGRPSRTGGMSVATAVVTATEGEEAATLDTAVMSSAAGTPTVTRNRYEFDLPWTQEEEQRLMEGFKLHTKPVEQGDSAKSQTNWRAVATHVGSRTQKAAKAQVKLLQAGRVAAESRPSQHNTLMEGALPSTGPLEASPDQGTSMALDTPSSSAGAGPLADEDGLGALEAVERLEGSPPPEDHMQQPLHPGNQRLSESTAAAAAAAAALHAQQQPPGQAEAAHLTDNLLPEWNAALTSSLPGAGLLPAQALPPGSASGGVSPPLGPLVFPNQASFHPAILQFLFGTLGQQPQGQLQGQPQGQPQDQQAQEQGLPQPLQLNHFMLPYHQAFVQQQMAASAASSAGFPQPPFGSLPPFMHPPPPGLGSLQQPLLPGQFGLLPPQGLHPSQVPLQPPESSALTGGSLPTLPGLSPRDQPFILQPPVVPQQGEGQDWVQHPESSQGVPMQGQDDASGPDRSSSQPSGAAEQPQPDHTRSLSDRQDSASQGQPETAQSMQADLAPGSSTGPEGPPSVSKGGRPGGSRVTPKAAGSTPKRQMNFWQEEEKAQFLNAYKMHGVDWDLLAKEVPTKEKTQIKNYYQNYKQRLELDQIELPLSAKHPKPSRTPSRATTPRPGSARSGSRQNSEAGEQVQAMMDEAVQAAKAAAAAVVSHPVGTTVPEAMDTDLATASYADLPGRDGNEKQLRDRSPDAAAALSMEETSISPLRGTPVRGLTPPRAITPPRRGSTPPPASVPNWGPADGIRQAWQGGSLLPFSSAPDLDSRLAASGLHSYFGRGRPSTSPQRIPQPTTAIAQNPFDPQPAMLGSSLSSQRNGEEEALHPADTSAVAVASHMAGALPAQTSSSSQPLPTSVSVSVSVHEPPVSTSAHPIQEPHLHGRPTLLSHTSSPALASSSTSGPLLPSLLRALAPGQVQAEQPSNRPIRQHSPRPLVQSPAAEVSSQSQPDLDVSQAGPSSWLPSTAAEDHKYDLSSAISKQFGSLPAPQRSTVPQSAPRPIEGGQEPRAHPAVIDDLLAKTQVQAQSQHGQENNVSVAGRLVSDSFDRLGQGNFGGHDGPSNEDAKRDVQMQPEQPHLQSAANPASTNADTDRDEQQDPFLREGATPQTGT